MTDDEICAAIAKDFGVYPDQISMGELDAFKLGWEARGKQQFTSREIAEWAIQAAKSPGTWEQKAKDFLAKATSHSESDLSGKPARP